MEGHDMNRRLLLVIAIGLSASVSAADFDGSRMLICAPVEAFDCAPADVCNKDSPREMGAPAFLRIDFEKKVIVGPKRTTPILHIERSAEQVILQGTELGHGWSMALNPQTGELSAALSSRDSVFVLFGSCTPL
jgi:hypothetical protein